MNNSTRACAPLRAVAENSTVLADQIEGLITREGQGQFEMTEFGKTVAVAEAAAVNTNNLAAKVLSTHEARLPK